MRRKYDPEDNIFRAAARRLGISSDEFRRRMEAMVKRFDLYERISTGDAKLRRIWIDKYEVPKHQVSGHWRYIEDRRTARKRSAR